ncbi:MAG: TolC family protein [Candidatus Zixiibacteriota bacterium]|nr:MAG: TolC family protein [candidate division Zixibacteria bacterium]
MQVVVLLIAAAGLLLAGPVTSEEQKVRVEVAFIEGGSYPGHSHFRNAFASELELLLPDQYELQLSARGFKTAGWHRDSSRIMAADLAADSSLDIIVALGPWVVEDLLAVGCSTPIIAAYRLDPIIEGLVDSTLRPVAENLTVRIRPGKIENDLTAMSRLLDIKRLGVLLFPLDDTAAGRERITDLTDNHPDLEIVTAEGYDNKGTYAFFKAYPKIKGQIDALYLSPLWGFNAVKISQFYLMTLRDRIPTVSHDGLQHLEKGALFTPTYESIRARAHYHAWKAARIIQGDRPANLPVMIPETTRLAVNETSAGQLGITLPQEVRQQAIILPARPADDSVPTMLNQAVDQALAQNPGYLAKIDLMTAAAREAKQVAAAYFPQLRLNAEAFYLDDNSVYNRFNEIENESYRAGLTLTQTVFSVETIRAIELAGRKRVQDSISVRRAGLDLELAVSLAYLTCLHAEEVLREQSAYLRRVDEIAQVNSVREKLGEIDHFDNLRWRDELEKANLARIRSEADLEIAGVLYNLLLGQPGNTPVYLDTTRYSRELLIREYVQLRPYLISPESRERTMTYLIGAALGDSPTLNWHDSQIRLGQIRLAANKARLWPRVGLQASLDVLDDLARTESFRQKHSEWSVGGRLTWSIFSGGERIHERGRLKAQLSAAEYQKDNAMLDAIGRIRSATIRMASALTALPPAERSQELAEQFAQEAIDHYIAGKRSYVELLDAEQNRLDARLSLINTQYGYWRAAAQLLNESGWSISGNSYPASVVLLNRLTEADLQ